MSTIRTELLKDFAAIPDFAAAVDRDIRTVKRWMKERDGLPYTRMGNRTFIHIPSAQQWLVKRIRQPNPRRAARQAS